MTNYQMVIGLEIHVQLNTESKLFSGSSTTFGKKANHNASLIDLAFPGTLPVINEKAISHAIRFGLAIDANINQTSIFERKNYFYPDLPKGYQTSQLELPIVGKGYLDIPLSSGETKKITITRAHLEEDAGKSLHENFHGKSGIDLNRAGIPLLEVVSEPEMHSADEAVSYMKTLHQLVKHLDICDGNMQEGSFRCDVNLSLRPVGEKKLGTRTEIKNLNSFKFVEKAIFYEAKRQAKLLDEGKCITQETRLYSPEKNITKAMRSKEDAHDYRYFPCPDLLPVVVSDETIERIKKSMPKSHQDLIDDYQKDCGLNLEDAQFLAKNTDFGQFFKATLDLNKALSPKAIINWLRGEIAKKLKDDRISLDEMPLKAKDLSELLSLIDKGTVSKSNAKVVLNHLWQSDKSAQEIIKLHDLAEADNQDEIKSLLVKLIEENPKQASELQGGKDKLIGFFVGQVMKAMKGKANPKETTEILKKLLSL